MTIAAADLTPEPEPGPEPVAEGQQVPPTFLATAFQCVHCGVLAQQKWEPLWISSRSRSIATLIYECRCGNCTETSVWRDPSRGEPRGPQAHMIFPASTSAPRPHLDLPSGLRDDFEEARRIADLSPRGAAALLRLVLQKLMVVLGEKGENINKDIKALIDKGLPVEVQQALDALRVFGNYAVHPGEIDISDDRETVAALFDLLNYIVEQQIAQPKARAAMYSRLPAGVIKQIETRDGPKEA